jgi:AcrR family transcriptional regulator
MARPAKAPKPHHERSRATRARVLAAATGLFVRDGYVATTMAAIAAEAGVAVQSLYLRFGSKLAILSAALDVAIVGDDEPIAHLDRPWVHQLANTHSGPQAVRLWVSEVRRICSRTYPIYAVGQAAAAGEAGELLAVNKRQRREGMRAIASVLSLKPGFRPDLTVETAGDMMYGLGGEDPYGLLVVDCGWQPDAWEAWCADVLVSVLFPNG